MSIRVFYRRGRKVELEQLDDFVAQAMTDEQRDAADAAPPLPPSDILSDDAGGSVTNDLNAFRRAGWVIVPATQSDEVLGAAASESAPVFRDRSQNRLLIGTKRLAVKFRDNVSAEEATSKMATAGVTVLRTLGFSKNLYQVEVGPGQDAIDAAAALQTDPAVEYAEPELIEHLPTRFQPSDPQYARQWQWNNNGSLGGTPKADVRAELAWDIGKGQGIRVAVIDNGFDVDHPDLSAALDDTTAFFALQPNGDTDLKRTRAGFPNANHGTFCAGMVGAREGNGEGGCGAAPDASLLLIACLDDQVGSQVTLARAVAYAAQPSLEPAATTSLPGADVIACSLGPNNARWDITSVLDDALNFAATQGRGGKGIPIFWAVDNAPNPVANDEVCSHPQTIAVGRSTRNDKENGSAFGPELEFLAPGVDVFSTRSGGGYGASTGTSYAAPCAAGVAALVLAAKPDATAAEVRKFFTDTCDEIGGVTYTAGRHDKYGFGRINAARAVNRALGVEDDEPVMDDEAPAGAKPPLVGPQFPSPQGDGETQWTAPSIVRIKLANETAPREVEVSIIDGRAVFEGDIVLTRGLETLGVGHSEIGRRWPRKTVVYDIHPALPNQARVTKAIAAWDANSVIRFKKRELEKNYVLFRAASGCSSAVGMIGGVQFITLGPNCNEWNAAHEIGHAVGLWHEQSREDRDRHVTIHWENIDPEAHHNFRQQIEDGDDINAYDHDSIMHYSLLAFSINGLPTIVPKANKPIGQRDHLSEGDIAAVAKMYDGI